LRQRRQRSRICSWRCPPQRDRLPTSAKQQCLNRTAKASRTSPAGRNPTRAALGVDAFSLKRC